MHVGLYCTHLFAIFQVFKKRITEIAVNFSVHMVRLHHFWSNMLSDRCLSCLSCLSVTLVYCCQTVGRIKVKLGMQVGLGPGHICVRWGPSSPSPKGAQPPIFGLYLLRLNGCMDQDVTWFGARPRPRRLCVRWGPHTPPQKGRGPPNFRPMFIVTKWLDG